MSSRLTLLLILCASAALPQSFGVRVQQGAEATNLASEGVITMASGGPGRPVVASILFNYRGTLPAAIETMTLSAPSEFTMSSGATFPINVAPGQNVPLTIQFLPRTGARLTGRLIMSFREGLVVGSLALNLVGTAPEFVVSAIGQPDSNAVPLGDGASVWFPSTLLGTSIWTAVVVVNRGSGTGTLRAVSIAGDAFQPSSLPLLPAAIEAGREFRFNIRFNPRQQGPAEGSAAIDFVTRRIGFALRGSGVSPVLTYEPPAPGNLISFPETSVGARNSITMRVRNTGTADARVAAISVLGAGFQLTDLPFLPAVLAPGNSLSFGLAFAPSQPGRLTGRLRVGEDVFDLAGSAHGPTLIYSYAVGSAVTPIAANEGVIFTPAAVGSSTEAVFSIRNSGTAPASLSSIGLTGAGFRLADLPALPMQLPADAVIEFRIVYEPSAPGPSTATLRVGSQAFPLSAAALPPPPLPSYAIEGAGGVVEPFEQPAIGLRLSRPYPMTVSGTLTLNFRSEVFSPDPMVQFATGGRTVEFTIPANTTQAVFRNNAEQVRFQTGTVAGLIVVTPFFSLPGGVNLTPADPAGLVLTVPPKAPRLLEARIGQVSATGFTLQVTGFATSRAARQFEFEFAPAPGVSIPENKTAVDVEAPFALWYQSAPSQAFGGLFTASVAFALDGASQGVSQALQSVTVRMSGREGASNTVTVPLR